MLAHFYVKTRREIADTLRKVQRSRSDSDHVPALSERKIASDVIALFDIPSRHRVLQSSPERNGSGSVQPRGACRGRSYVP